MNVRSATSAGPVFSRFDERQSITTYPVSEERASINDIRDSYTTQTPNDLLYLPIAPVTVQRVALLGEMRAWYLKSQAEAHEQRGEYAEAARIYHQLGTGNYIGGSNRVTMAYLDKSVDAAAKVVDPLIATNRLKNMKSQAIPLLEGLVRGYPPGMNSAKLLEAQWKLARCYRQCLYNTEAIATYTRLAQHYTTYHNPERAFEAYEAVADMHLRTNNLDRAVSVYDAMATRARASGHSALHIRALTLKAQAYQDAGRAEAATAVRSGVVEGLIAEGRSLNTASQYEKAAASLAQAAQSARNYGFPPLEASALAYQSGSHADLAESLATSARTKAERGDMAQAAETYAQAAAQWQKATDVGQQAIKIDSSLEPRLLYPLDVMYGRALENYGTALGALPANDPRAQTWHERTAHVWLERAAAIEHDIQPKLANSATAEDKTARQQANAPIRQRAEEARVQAAYALERAAVAADTATNSAEAGRLFHEASEHFSKRNLKDRAAENSLREARTLVRGSAELPPDAQVQTYDRALHALKRALGSGLLNAAKTRDATQLRTQVEQSLAEACVREAEALMREAPTTSEPGKDYDKALKALNKALSMPDVLQGTHRETAIAARERVLIARGRAEAVPTSGAQIAAPAEPLPPPESAGAEAARASASPAMDWEANPHDTRISHDIWHGLSEVYRVESYYLSRQASQREGRWSFPRTVEELRAEVLPQFRDEDRSRVEAALAALDTTRPPLEQVVFIFEVFRCERDHEVFNPDTVTQRSDDVLKAARREEWRPERRYEAETVDREQEEEERETDREPGRAEESRPGMELPRPGRR